MSDAYATKDGGVRINGHMVFQDRVPRKVFRATLFIVFEILGAERHTLIKDHMRTDDSGLANNDSRSVVNTEMVSYLRRRMNIDTCPAVRQFRQHSRL